MSSICTKLVISTLAFSIAEKSFTCINKQNSILIQNLAGLLSIAIYTQMEWCDISTIKTITTNDAENYLISTQYNVKYIRPDGYHLFGSFAGGVISTFYQELPVFGTA